MLGDTVTVGAAGPSAPIWNTRRQSARGAEWSGGEWTGGWCGWGGAGGAVRCDDATAERNDSVETGPPSDWFQCVFGANDERKAERIVFSAELTLKGSMDQVYTYCEREIVHYVACARVLRMQRELESMRALQLSGCTVATTLDPQFPAELPSLLVDLGHPLLSLIDPLLTFLHESHGLLRSTYIFLTLHFAKFDSALHPRMRSDAANKLLVDLNQFEYFVDALDQTIMPAPNVRRSQRSLAQMNDTVRYVRKYAKAFSATLAFFQSTELQHENEEETTKAFFAALDAAAADAKK